MEGRGGGLTSITMPDQQTSDMRQIR